MVSFVSFGMKANSPGAAVPGGTIVEAKYPVADKNGAFDDSYGSTGPASN